jgi:hypothetical protein
MAVNSLHIFLKVEEGYFTVSLNYYHASVILLVNLHNCLAHFQPKYAP